MGQNEASTQSQSRDSGGRAADRDPPVPLESSIDTRRWLLRQHYEEINANFRTAWELYIKFYTVFLTFNVAALAALLSAKVALADSSKWIIVGAFVLQDLLCAVTSGFMARFSERSGKLLDEASIELLADGTKATKGLSARTLPIDLGRWAGWANCGAMLAMVALWIGAGLTKWT